MRHISVSFAIFLLFVYGGLIASIFYFFSPADFMEYLHSDRILFAIKTSLAAATLATLLALLIAIPAGFALSRHKFFGKNITDTILEFPMVVSPAALGAIVLIFFNNPLGEWIQNNLITFIFSFSGIVLAQFLTVVGVATRFAKAAFDEVDTEFENTANTLGANPLYTFFTITLPLAKRGLIAGMILSWAKALGEFGATLTIAGTMPFRTETLPISIYLHLEMADIKGTVTIILILLSFGLGALFLTRMLLQRLQR
ncbi:MULTISPECIES: ABC transporter permease [unclassified Nitratiruptor]|uniref:ABC transporter permease n=1 Tax=unclassified Nitratiruptor TaxID=2624044 RepID=UPI001934C3D3|nr:MULTISPECIES: ABC transporter permease subunit [unclassified Nitratiruptor]BCD59287.1 molybdate transport system permease protein [Nitratiruptor sp. YY08-10]BCD63211.1 molybdate transport system permease protein [Nitratiruptor sp. YY08-14]